MPGHDAADVVTRARSTTHGSIAPDDAGAHPPLQHRGARAQPRRSRRRRAASSSPMRAAARCSRCSATDCVLASLEHDDPLPLPGAARGAEGGAALAGQDTAGLHQRRAAQLDRLPEARRRRLPGAGRLSHLRRAEPAGRHRRATAERSPDKPILLSHGAHALPARPAGARAAQGRPRRAAGDAVRDVRAQDPRPARPHRWPPAASIRRATSPRITVNRWPHGYAPEYNPLWRAGPAAGAAAERHRPRRASAASPSPIRIPAAPPTPTRRSTRRAGRWTSSWLCHRRSDPARSEQPDILPGKRGSVAMQTG